MLTRLILTISASSISTPIGFSLLILLIVCDRIIGLVSKKRNHTSVSWSLEVQEVQLLLCEVVGCLLFTFGVAIVADGPGGEAVEVWADKVGGSTSLDVATDEAHALQWASIWMVG